MEDSAEEGDKWRFGGGTKLSNDRWTKFRIFPESYITAENQQEGRLSRHVVDSTYRCVATTAVTDKQDVDRWRGGTTLHQAIGRIMKFSDTGDKVRMD